MKYLTKVIEPASLASDLPYSTEVITPVSMARDLPYSTEVITPLSLASDLKYLTKVIEPAKLVLIVKNNYNLDYRDMSLIAPYADLDSHFGVKLYKIYSSIISNDTDTARILLKDYITEREQVAIPDFTIYNILGIHD